MSVTLRKSKLPQYFFLTFSNEKTQIFRHTGKVGSGNQGIYRLDRGTRDPIMSWWDLELQNIQVGHRIRDPLSGNRNPRPQNI